MYAVAGVTGNTGSVVAEELIGRGKKVRVIVRSEEKGPAWKEKGAEVAIASVDDASALARALDGVEGAYLLLPPDPASQDLIARGRELGETYASAIRKSGLKHVVFLSSIGAHQEAGTGPIRALREIEQRLAPLGINVTFLRPAYFMENWASSLAPAAESGALPSFVPADLSIPQVATRDIGKAAADALENPPQGVRIIELAGPAEYSPSEIATTVGDIIGKNVNAAVGPLDAVVPAFTSFGISKPMAELYREMYEGIISGRVSWDGAGERKRGTTSPKDVLAKMIG
jgi:uncharacterized protein YbjT (DUF2867 family)